MRNENYTYILECSDGTYYTGWTNHLQERVEAHNQGKGAKYTKPRRPVKLVYYEVFPTKQEAMSREWQIKHMTKKKKELLILGNHKTDRMDTDCSCEDDKEDTICL